MKADLIDIENALIEQTDQILKGVSEYLRIFDVKVDIIEEEKEDEEYEIGLRAVQNYSQDASMLGGIENSPKEIRKFLATTSLSQTDFFGNTELSPGVPIRIPIDPNKAYTGMLKAVMNETDYVTILKKLHFYTIVLIIFHIWLN